ncbi:hypothetical protein [Amycolatopsis sp. cmx-4-83]|uniref:hypothetical protein n=1 Tax=Amycolatopsis sp. cmx-4-83 TaxID=2790940 RepID=UPI003979A3AD
MAALAGALLLDEDPAVYCVLRGLAPPAKARRARTERAVPELLALLIAWPHTTDFLSAVSGRRRRPALLAYVDTVGRLQSAIEANHGCQPSDSGEAVTAIPQLTAAAPASWTAAVWNW